MFSCRTVYSASQVNSNLDLDPASFPGSLGAREVMKKSGNELATCGGHLLFCDGIR